VCPLCLLAYPSDAIEAGVLTREHVPPRSVGGTRLVLTCKKCNDSAGHNADIDALREATTHDFLAGDPREFNATLLTKSSTMPVCVNVSAAGVQMFGVPTAAHPIQRENLNADLETASQDDNWKDFEFKLNFEAYNQKRAAASWLRATYLAFFATLGYRFVCRSELDVVRARILKPESDWPPTFRIVRPVKMEPTLTRVESPDVFRSYVMMWGRYVVFLPRYNDHTLYERLAEQPDTSATLSGLQYPWPRSGPTFFHDRLISE
jgi:hypothetical protein